MGIKHESGHEALRFRADNVSGARAANGYLLRFSVSYQLSAWKSVYGAQSSIFRGFRARLDIGPDNLRLGRADAEFPQVLCPYEFEQQAVFMFELRVSASTIEAIEALRAGDGFEVAMQIACERVSERPAVEHDDVLFRISQSEWIHTLEQMNYGVNMLVEFPLELGKDGELSEIWRALDKARKLLHTGHYSSVVTECRKALETALKHFERSKDVKAAVKQYALSYDERQAMSKRDRLHYLMNAANHATHLSAHPDVNNQAVDYSREEALMIFGAVVSAIAYLARESTTN